MSTDSLFSEERGLDIQVVSPEEIRKCAQRPQSSGLSSSLARSLARSSSVPSSGSTPSSPACESRLRLASAFESHARQDSIPEEHLGGSAFDAEDTAADSSVDSRPIVRRPRKVARQPTPGDDADAEEDGEFVPPHLLSLPTFAGRQAGALRPGSLFEGVGRKLRGMDAVRFRRSVMQQTGFLEPTASTSLAL